MGKAASSQQHGQQHGSAVNLNGPPGPRRLTRFRERLHWTRVAAATSTGHRHCYRAARSLRWPESSRERPDDDTCMAADLAARDQLGRRGRRAARTRSRSRQRRRRPPAPDARGPGAVRRRPRSDRHADRDVPDSISRPASASSRSGTSSRRARSSTSRGRRHARIAVRRADRCAHCASISTA